ncbi:hypothetical protein UCRPC4_g05312 [Phaeomoniella chlamydospora]|uniref:BTB domain-containing protein n=1 Tax=Phaeomoniella chlamydospora TaxID=158046 RepID=A0A0G2E4M8_PHACM|nr:hypothetical protein UCRPC4_g05312 [Phaeomoniella chlamydospora]
MALRLLEPVHRPMPGNVFIVINWDDSTPGPSMSSLSGTVKPWIGVICSKDMLDGRMQQNTPSTADVRDLFSLDDDPCKGIPHNQRLWAVFLPYKGIYRWVRKHQLRRLDPENPPPLTELSQDEKETFNAAFTMVTTSIPPDKSERLNFWRAIITGVNRTDEERSGETGGSSRNKSSSKEERPALCLNPLDSPEEQHREEMAEAARKIEQQRLRDMKNRRKRNKGKRRRLSSLEVFGTRKASTHADYDSGSYYKARGVNSVPQEFEDVDMDDDFASDMSTSQDSGDESHAEEIRRNIEISMQNEILEDAIHDGSERRGSRHTTKKGKRVLPSTRDEDSHFEDHEPPTTAEQDFTVYPSPPRTPFVLSSLPQPLLPSCSTSGYRQDSPSTSKIKIYIGPSNRIFHLSSFEIDKCPLLESYVRTRRSLDRDHGQEKYIMDPNFMDVDPDVFSHVVEFLRVGDYSPRIELGSEREGLGAVNLDSEPSSRGQATDTVATASVTIPLPPFNRDSNANTNTHLPSPPDPSSSNLPQRTQPQDPPIRSNSSTLLLRSTHLYKLADRLALPALKSLILQKVSAQFPREEGYSARAVLEAASILYESQTSILDGEVIVNSEVQSDRSGYIEHDSFSSNNFPSIPHDPPSPSSSSVLPLINPPHPTTLKTYLTTLLSTAFEVYWQKLGPKFNETMKSLPTLYADILRFKLGEIERTKERYQRVSSEVTVGRSEDWRRKERNKLGDRENIF